MLVLSESEKNSIPNCKHRNERTVKYNIKNNKTILFPLTIDIYILLSCHIGLIFVLSFQKKTKAIIRVYRMHPKIIIINDV